MGLFSPNYAKPGPGVDKNAPEKHRIWQFFEIFWNQLSKLCKANLLYFVAMIPLMLGLYLCFKIDVTAPSGVVLRTPGEIDLLGLLLLVASVFVTFPATLGFTYILRNIQRREHAWIWHDFVKHTKLYYKKGVINGAITLVLYYLLLNAYALYRGGIFNIPLLDTYLSILMLIIMLIFTWMQFYVNTMIVTFDMKLRDIYRNSFLFAIAKIPLNLIISIICVVLAVGLWLIPLITIFGTLLIAFSLFGFIVVFSVYPTIDKHMISKASPRETDETEAVFNDNRTLKRNDNI